jgi:hypothetical protein
MSTDLLSDIQKAVERAGECKSEHIESLAVVETFRGQTAWEGIVEAFKLIGHPKAKRAYGWAYQDGKETRFVAVLEIPPVTSANTAVRAAIAAGAQK